MSDHVAIAEDGYLESFRRVSACVPHGSMMETPLALHIMTGARIGMMNPTLIKDATGDVDLVLGQAVDFHERNGSPAWNLVSRAADFNLVEKAALSKGFSFGRDLPIMVLETIPDANLPEGLTIERVADADGIKRHYLAAADGFEMDFADIEVMSAPGMLTPDLVHFIGHLDDQVVGASMVSRSSGAGSVCGGVFNVATLPDYRGRGIGTAMTAHAAALAREEWTAEIAFLLSSDAGYEVYRKMGYREVARWQSWLPPV